MLWLISTNLPLSRSRLTNLVVLRDVLGDGSISPQIGLSDAALALIVLGNSFHEAGPARLGVVVVLRLFAVAVRPDELAFGAIIGETVPHQVGISNVEALGSALPCWSNLIRRVLLGNHGRWWRDQGVTSTSWSLAKDHCSFCGIGLIVLA